MFDRSVQGGTLVERPLDIPLRVDRAGSVKHFEDALGELRRRFGARVVRGEWEAIDRAEGLHDKVRALRGRSMAVRAQIVELERELAACESQAIGYERAVEGLLTEIVDRIEARHGPVWSPWPAYGFRMWRVEGGGLHGAVDWWPEPELTAECRQRSWQVGPLPHDSEKCGPPSCGIYVVKELPDLLAEFAAADFSRLVVGLVAATGRVIEHELAYRAQHVRVVAATATVGRRFLMTDDPQRIFELFADPEAAALTFPDVVQTVAGLEPRAAKFLIEQKGRRTV
jgi:hypothetical protein